LFGLNEISAFLPRRQRSAKEEGAVIVNTKASGMKGSAVILGAHFESGAKETLKILTLKRVEHSIK
jgi:hypothetical protein